MGVKFDLEKLALLYGFCRFCPLVGFSQTSDDGKGVAFVLPKPTRVELVEVGLSVSDLPLPIFELHAVGKPSVEHPQATIYTWHNTVIPERMGKVPPSEWQPEWAIDEQNGEIRTILIREIGVERFLQHGKVIDSHTAYPAREWFQKSEYELVDLASLLPGVDYAPYLKMKNQTTGAIHCEGVHPDCRTIIDAMTFRTGIDFNNVEIGSIQ